MEIVHIATALQDPTNYPCVLATLVDIDGSSYRRRGARLLWTAAGQRIGSISGGCLENDLIARSQTLLISKSTSEVVTYDTTSENDLIWGVGTGCHGIIKLFLERLDHEPSWVETVLTGLKSRRTSPLFVTWAGNENVSIGTQRTAPAPDAATRVLACPITPSPRVVICGAGDDARPLTEICRNMGWTTAIVDPRPDMATHERFPAADAVRCLPVESTATAIDWDDQTVAVIMTHHYRYDLPLLKTIAPLKLVYLGLLGPKQRGDRLRKDANIDENCHLHSPVGLDLGGDGPAAVALSITAEIQTALHGRLGGSLNHRNRSIHAD